MSKSEGRLNVIVTNLMGGLMVAYMIGAMVATPLFNWEFARRNGFMKWLLLGEVVATAQAVGWPWFAYQRWADRSDDGLHNPSVPGEVASDWNGAFSVSVPAGWGVERSREGDHSEVMLKSGGDPEPGVRMIITSRRLDPMEQQLGELELIDRMLNMSLEQLKSQGTAIIDFGKVPPMVGTSPAFAITSQTEDGRHRITSWGTVTHTRTYGITAMTVLGDGNAAAMMQVRRVVESIEMHDPLASSR
jgi:hypothetical protein